LIDLSPLTAWALESGLELSPSQLDQMRAYLAALYKANEVMNLTRIPIEDAVVKHLIDSLLPQDIFPQGATVLDLGTGPGLPAWPLACARPDLSLMALDSTTKAIDFLASQKLPNLRPLNQRAEDAVKRESMDVVTGRAFAPLGIQMEASAPWAKIGGLVVPYRTLAEEAECQLFVHGQLGLELEELVVRELSAEGGRRLFPVYRKVRETPMEFPRLWAKMKKNPLSLRPLEL
jgi:16S rRNA (guanine527-N7)-methyltransferase